MSMEGKYLETATIMLIVKRNMWIIWDSVCRKGVDIFPLNTCLHKGSDVLFQSVKSPGFVFNMFLSLFYRCVSWFHCWNASTAHITPPSWRYNDHCLPWGDLNEDAKNAYFASCCFQFGHRWVRFGVCVAWNVLLNLQTSVLKWGHTVLAVTWELGCNREKDSLCYF